MFGECASVGQGWAEEVRGVGGEPREVGGAGGLEKAGRVCLLPSMDVTHSLEGIGSGD